MADVENELKDLREKNNELVQKVQYWKMTAAQRENEKLDLMKEINDLRLKISRLRSGGAANALKLDAALQSASEEALSHLVQASSAVARTLELAKTYVQERQELDTALPRWSTLSSTPSSEKINIVPPMLIGGRLIQPVVSLSRTLQSNISRSASRSPNEQNHSVSERAVPLHMLQDVYIPLTRIDAGERPVNNADTDMDVNHGDNSTEDLALDDSAERMMEESQNITESEDFEESRRLDVVSEDIEPEDGLTPERSRIENPLEGPSWLLDRPSSKRKIKSSTNLEPDSTTEFEDTLNAEPGPSHSLRLSEESRGAGAEPAPVCEFSPTVRRRRRTSPPATPHATPRAAASPHYSPRPARRYSNNGRILKVLVAKMRLDDDITNVSPPKRSKEETPPKSQRNNPNHPDARKQTGDGSPKYQVRDISPSKRLMRFDAPSPNGSTDSRVIVLEAKNNQPEPGCSGVSKAKTSNRINSIDGRNNRISNNNHDHNNQEESNNSQTDRNRNQSSDNNRSRDNHNRDSHNHDNRKRDSRNRDGHSNISVDGNNSRDSRDSDSSGSEMASEGRTRRPRKAIVYKEKPLNRKLRR